MLFDISRDDMVSALGRDALFVAPPAASRGLPEESEAHRLLVTTGIPTGIFRPQIPLNTGQFPLGRDKGGLSDHEAPQVSEDWVVFDWIPLTHLTLNLGSVHGFSQNGGPVQTLHQDLSSLVRLTFELQGLLKQFTLTDDNDADYERREEALSAIRETVEERDRPPSPLLTRGHRGDRPGMFPLVAPLDAGLRGHDRLRDRNS
ncbi:SUKH-4 family immunity protein [Streptomyces sp. NPDC005202]|uniref:SUKH-4 family immunity protein n=1 Tax=Streptomyces sp. NPDC005202 TaxID=3157021 RepID=UPI0033B402FF